MNLSKRLMVEPGTKAGIPKRDPRSTHGFKAREDAEETLQKNTAHLSELQYVLYAENKHAVLVILQAMDAGGKDGTIRHVMTGLNPQGTRVTSFKVPTPEESAHDFLWRIHRHVPGRGEIGIFNRSHYEDVLVVRVHKLVPREVWSKRYDEINAFERTLSESDVKIFKFFLHISKEEQKERFQQRLQDPTKRWKVSAADFAERKYWDDYMEAYEDALTFCSTDWAPWYVIPADKKWYRNFAVSQIIADGLKGLHMRLPEPSLDLSHISLE